LKIQLLKYISKSGNGLILFLTDGHIEMDSNPAERTIRPIALQRMNALVEPSRDITA
jgi:transposase